MPNSFLSRTFSYVSPNLQSLSLQNVGFLWKIWAKTQEKFGNVCVVRNFAVNLQVKSETKTPNAMNANEKTWIVKPKMHHEKYGQNVYNNKAYAEYVKETLCKDTGFEWIILESK